MSKSGRMTIARRFRPAEELTPEECSVRLLNITECPALTGTGTTASGVQNFAMLASEVKEPALRMPCLCEPGTMSMQPVSSSASSIAVQMLTMGVPGGRQRGPVGTSWCQGSGVERPAGLFIMIGRRARTVSP